jgi:hypothetical protein
MAVLFEQVDGWFRPRFVCDACQQPITDVHNAMVLYEEPTADDDTSLTRIWHAHKSEVCQSKARVAAGHEDGNGMWDELGNHIVMLAVDVGMFPAGFADRYDYLLRTDRVPPPPDDEA